MNPQWSYAQYTMPPSSIAVSYATSTIQDAYTISANVSLPVVSLELTECPEDFVPPLPPLTSIPPPPIEPPPPLDPPLPTEEPPANPPLPTEPPPIDPSPPTEPPPPEPLSNYQYDTPPPGLYAPELPIPGLFSTEAQTTEVRTIEVHTIEAEPQVRPPSLYSAFVCPNKFLSDATNFVPKKYSIPKSNTASSSVYTTTPPSGFQPVLYCDQTQGVINSPAQFGFSQSIPYAIPQSEPNSALPNCIPSGVEQCYEICNTPASTTWNQNTSANYFPSTVPRWEQSSNVYGQESENVQPFHGGSHRNYEVQYGSEQMHENENPEKICNEYNNYKNSNEHSGFRDERFKYFSNKIGDRRNYTNSSSYNSYRSSVSSAISTCTKRKRESCSEGYLGDRKRFKVEGNEPLQGYWSSSKQIHSKYHSLSTKAYKYICSSPAEKYYSSTKKDSKEVVATNPLIALFYRFNYELVDRAMRVKASKPKSRLPKRRKIFRKYKLLNDSDEDNSNCDSDSEEDENTAVNELKKKRSHPDRLHYELWFNDPKEMNDGPLCKCSVKTRRSGIGHGIYAGEEHLPHCNPFSNNSDRLHHYKITMAPLTNFQTDYPTTIFHESHKYYFEGFSMFSHSPLPKLPDCKVIRFNYEYAIQYVEEDFPKNFTVQGLDLFNQYLLTEILELVDVNWKAHDDSDGCPRFHFMPRFSRELEDGGKELLAHCHVLEYLLNKNKILIQESQLPMILKQRTRMWERLIDEVRGMIVTCPGKKPSSIRVDQLDRVNHYDRDKFPVIVHFGMRPPQLSYVGNPYYQKARKDYIRFRHLLANKAKVTCQDRHKLIQKESRLQEMRLESDLKREVTIEVSSRNFYKTGIMSDIVQHAMLLPVLMCHLRFHLSLSHLEAKLEYKFKDRFLLQLALTHPSYRENFGTNPDHARNSLSNCGLRQPQYSDRRIHHVNTRKRGINTLINIMSRFGRERESSSFINHNERLEFLGDAVIEFITTVHLYYMFPDVEEGGLSTYRASIVQNQHLSHLSQRLELDRYMLYAHGSDLSHDLEFRHAMANCFEALMAALFLDSGIEIADKVFSKTLFDEPELLEAWQNFSIHPLQEQEPGGDRKLIESIPSLKKVAKFEETIGIEFNHIRLLARALTHRSLGYNNLTMGSNQRLEFLGDSVLQLVASEYLYNFFPEHHEGHLSLLRSSLVNNRTISVVCSDLGMGEYALYAESKIEISPKDKADMLEAFLGALYVDKDLGYCRKFCEVCFFPRLQDFILNQEWNDPKSKLQQCCLTLRSATGGEPDIPTYKVVECKGPTNTRMFSVAVYFEGNRLALGSAQSIQQAQMNAAAQALEDCKDLFPQLRHQRQAVERMLRKDPPIKKESTEDCLIKEISDKDYLKENASAEDPLKQSTEYQLKDKKPTNNLPYKLLTIDQIKKEPSEDQFIEKTPSKNQLDKKESTRDQLKVNELSKYQLKEKNSWLREIESIKEEELLEEESSSEEEGEIKEEKSTNKRKKRKISTMVQLNEKVSIDIQLHEKASTNVQLNEKVLSKDCLKAEILTKDQLKRKESTESQLKRKESTESQLKEKESTKKRLLEKETTNKQLEKKSTNNQLKEESLTEQQLKKGSTNDQLKKEGSLKDQLKKEKSTKDQLKRKESLKVLKQTESPKNQLKRIESVTNQLLGEESSEEEGEIKEKKSTKNCLKSKVSTMVQLKEKVSTNAQSKEKVATNIQLKEKASSNVQLQKKVSPNTQLKEKVTTNNQLKEKVALKDQLKEKIATNIPLKEKIVTNVQLKEKVSPNIKLKEKIPPNVQLKEKVVPNVQLKEKVSPNAQLKEKAATNVLLKNKMLTSVQQEKVSANVQLKKKISTNIQPKEKVATNIQLKAVSSVQQEKVSANVQLKEKVATNTLLKDKVLTSVQQKKVATNVQTKDKVPTNVQLTEKISTNVQLKEKVAINVLLKDKVGTKNQLKEKVATNLHLKEKVLTSVQEKEKVLNNVQLKEKISANVQPKEKVATNIQLKEKVATEDQLKKKVVTNIPLMKVSTNIQLNEKVSTNIQLKEKISTNVQLKEKVPTKVQLTEKVSTNVQLKEKVVSKSQLKEKISIKGQLKEKESPKNQLKEKKISKYQLKERELITSQVKKKESYTDKLLGKVLTKEQQLNEELSDLEEGEIID